MSMCTSFKVERCLSKACSLPHGNGKEEGQGVKKGNTGRTTV